MTLALLLALAAGQSEPPVCDGSQAEMNACAARDFERVDAELNARWREIIDHARENDRSPDSGRLPGDDRTEETTLREAQRAWVAFRDAHCTWQGFSERGGSLETLIFESCRAELTRERIGQLSPQPTPDE